MRRIHRYHWILFCFIFPCCFINRADASFPLPPRFSANALASDYTVGQLDLLLPLNANSGHNLYIDPTLAYGSDNQGYADLGLGYRWIHNEAAVLGGYVFGGYSRIDNNARLWVANPGVEAFGSRWDAHLNGYWVGGNRNQSASNFFGPVFFSGHSAFILPYEQQQHAGSGGDVQLGYQVFPQSSLKAYVGSYFFAPPQVSNIWGGAAGLEYWLDSYLKVVASYTYDNVRHNTAALGLGVEFGGTHTHHSNPALTERLTDPVERYLSELGRGSAIPSRTNTRRQRMTITTASGEQVEVPIPPIPIWTDIAFFSQSGLPDNGGMDLTLQNCTSQDPCGPSDFSQTGIDTLNSLLQGTTMYFNGGDYPALNSAGTGAITLHAGQSVHSRTDDYRQAATDADRSRFHGAFVLTGSNTLENIILLPTTTVNERGISATNANNLLVTGSQIGSESNSFQPAIDVTNVNDMLLNDSEIFSINAGPPIFFMNSKATLQNSAVTFVETAAIVTTATIVSNGSLVDLLDTRVKTRINISRSGSASGIVVLGGGQVTARRVTIDVQESGVGKAIALEQRAGTFLVDNSHLEAFAAMPSQAFIKIGTVTITNSTCVLNNTPLEPCP